MRIQERNKNIKELEKIKSKIAIGETLTQEDQDKMLDIVIGLLRSVKINWDKKLILKGDGNKYGLWAIWRIKVLYRYQTWG